jgi:hypothetical protein
MVPAIQHVNIDPEAPEDAFCRAGIDTIPATGRNLRQSRRDADIRRRIARLALHPMRTLCRGRTALITVIPVGAAPAPDADSLIEDASARDGSAAEAPAIAAAEGADGTVVPVGGPFASLKAQNVIFIAVPATAGRREHSRKSKMGNDEHERHA